METSGNAALARRLTLAAGLLYIAVRVLHLLRWDLWFDELFGVGLSFLDWGQLLARAASDQTNPPLFYLLLKVWTTIGGADPAWLRLLPLLCALAALIPLFRLARLLRWSTEVTVATLLLAALSPLLIFYSVEIRAYPLLFTLSLAALAETATLVLEPPPQRNALLRLAGWNVLLVLTHYFGWFVVAAEGIALISLGGARWRIALLAALPAFVAFLPWVWAVASAAATQHAVAPTIAWIPRPGPVEVADLPGFLLGGDPGWTRVITSAICVAAVWLGLTPPRTSEPRERNSTRLLAIFTLVPILLAFVASWVLPRSIYASRNLIITALPLLALIVLGLARSGRRPLQVGVTLLVLLAGWTIWRSDDAKISWSSFARRIAPTTADSVPAYAFESYTALPLRYYATLTDSRIRVEMIHGAADLRAPEGWVVARDSAWPGKTRGSAAFADWGLVVTDSVVTGKPGQMIRGWRYSKATVNRER